MAISKIKAVFTANVQETLGHCHLSGELSMEKRFEQNRSAE